MSRYDGANYPGILLREGPAGQRAALAGGPDVWEIIAARRAIKVASPELDGDELVTAMMASTGLARHSVDVALRYYADHRAEIDERIAANELNEGVRAALGQLDGSPKSAASLLTGVPAEQLDEYGGATGASPQGGAA